MEEQNGKPPKKALHIGLSAVLYRKKNKKNIHPACSNLAEGSLTKDFKKTYRFS